MRRYNKSVSRDYWARSSEFFTSYADGNYVEGVYGYDSLVVGDVELEKATFGLAEFLSVSVPFHGVDGVFPLGPAHRDPWTNVRTFMKSAMDESVISDPVFSVYLPSRRRGPNAHGEIVFGGIDTTKYDAADLTYVEIINKIDPTD
ncbi:Fibroblast growth factor receptor substrate 3 [Mortierella alpina]|nr:Fibroblast growth factor receptor substrate 3 [Mortierella alpina]